MYFYSGSSSKVLCKLIVKGIFLVFCFKVLVYEVFSCLLLQGLVHCLVKALFKVLFKVFLYKVVLNLCSSILLKVLLNVCCCIMYFCIRSFGTGSFAIRFLLRPFESFGGLV